MNVSDMLSRVEYLVKSNSTSLLTGVGVSGSVATAVLAAKASFKASREIDDLVHQDISAGPVTNKEIVKAVWPLYIPAVGVGSITIASIILANRLGSKQAAALTAAYGISERAFTEYRAKVIEKLGQRSEQKVLDEIAQERVTRNPPNSQTVIITGAGEVLCMDAWSGRYFMSTAEKIQQAANAVGLEVINHMSAGLGHFYDELELPPTAYSNDVGWNSDNYMDVFFSSALTPENRPCLVVDFRNPPIYDYAKLY